MSNSQEKSKKDREVFVCELVAREVNKTQGTDFHAEPNTEKAPDAVLVSASGRHPYRYAEVVSIPRDLIFRKDNNNIRKIAGNLSGALREGGLDPCELAVMVTDNANQHRIKPPLLKPLA